MIKTKRIYANGFYIFQSKVAANSNYIESLKEAKRLMTYARYFLKDHLIIHDYVINASGWQMAVQINSDLHLSNSNKESELWREISEKVRLFLSTYVRGVNFSRKRTGVLVHSNYSKYYFESLEEALGHLDKMRKQQVRLYQRNKKYRGIKYHYQIDKTIEKGSIFLCSRALSRSEDQVKINKENVVLWGLPNLVGIDLINYTLKRHSQQILPPKTQNSS